MIKKYLTIAGIILLLILGFLGYYFYISNEFYTSKETTNVILNSCDYNDIIIPLLIKTFGGAKTTHVSYSQITNIFTVVVKDNIIKEKIKILAEELIKNPNYIHLETEKHYVYDVERRIFENKTFAFSVTYFIHSANDCGDVLNFYTDNNSNKTIFISATSLGCSRDN
ncbi:MAG: hypothetical protein US42_C0013G0010 [Candidatus Magasanikbacteria bacterium GW2011_GWC2_37_14]|uniref:Uncharacterized protein n=1 Tax=Candidatus Magasanikbacteria bacterium GW2011_GWC2_37_14 TaxID=1619046 RepID=A0A0G0JGF5_9BACT|nr:MAG: hypothetical protein US42_C0013G0010 [Candidatus Magasanikbacteria bacterium GW2011_GWC2_37_14]